MKLVINEKQLKLILSKESDLQDVMEQGDTPEPSTDSGSSDGGSSSGGGTGYPSVSKWESGASRGPGNQVGATKWSDIVGSTLKRDKGNPLN